MKSFLVAFTTLMAVVGLVAAMPAPQGVEADVRLPSLGEALEAAKGASAGFGKI
ncbi:hypothetical protein BO85DRAFT_520847 [Aspergillus piperis CBS 112811]|uniref:Uncharacterized protein n=1 Tax=Aspergillus piperis CBS 112811 TaxID=1448313 RepID=A0A8G1R036_9EURO|nr:hypothetical protein BO85DRAFT_520847 [Aspergillus piperis CBS 112811]RAH56732.1 hypothetical protein BO85DRAFT_520847 [Aspergillus piperis CBS 112811]